MGRDGGMGRDGVATQGWVVTEWQHRPRAGAQGPGPLDQGTGPGPRALIRAQIYNLGPNWGPWGLNLGPNLYIGPPGPLFIYLGAPGAHIYLFWGPWGPQLFIYLWALLTLVGPWGPKGP